MKVTLREINQDNRVKCLSLKVTPEQLEFVTNNECSLWDAQENMEVARPFAIYADEEMIGFTMFAFNELGEDPSDRYWLWRLMIDSTFQGRGYGILAMIEIIDYFKENGVNEITLSTKDNNIKALSLYRKFGFRENGEMNEDEIVLKLYL